MTFIQPPDLGIDFNQDGNKANNVNGKANANAKPNIPIAGATTLPVVETSTNKKPMIGPVQENDTNDKVNAIKKNKMLNTALVERAFKALAPKIKVIAKPNVT